MGYIEVDALELVKLLVVVFLGLAHQCFEYALVQAHINGYPIEECLRQYLPKEEKESEVGVQESRVLIYSIRKLRSVRHRKQTQVRREQFLHQSREVLSRQPTCVL